MNRSKIETAIKAFCPPLGLSFCPIQHSAAAKISTPINSLRITDLSLHNIEGRQSGYATYSLSVEVVRTADTATKESVESRCDAMESEILDLLTQLSTQPFVVGCEEIRIKPQLRPLSSSPEIAMKASCQVVTLYTKR